MSLLEVVPRLIWEGSGNTDSIELSVASVPITYADDAFIVVEQLDGDTGVVTTLVQDVDYTLSLDSVAPGGSAATLERIAGNLATGTLWVAYRSSPVRQEGHIENGGDFSSSDIEAMLDSMAEVQQELADQVDRALKLDPFGVAYDADDLPIGKVGYMDVKQDVEPDAPAAGYNRIFAKDDNLVYIKDPDGNVIGTVGAAASIEIGTVTTGAAGSSAAVVNSGTESEAILDFTIPRGDTGFSGNGTGDMLAAQNLNDVSDKPTAFANIKQAASTSATGVVELATDAEAAGVGADATRYITAAQLHESRVDVASASTTDIGAAASNFIRITGTVTITGLGVAPAGTWRDIIFEGALILTHNAGSLRLPGGANITTAASDRCRARNLDGTDNWYIMEYTKTSGKAIIAPAFSELTSQAAGLAAAPFGPFTNIASATTTDLSTVPTVGVNITGVVTITSFGTGANLLRVGKFASTLLLTYHATDLILPGLANITTAAGDSFVAMSDASGKWTVVSYTRASGVTGAKAADRQPFTGSGTWTKPSGFGAKSMVLIQAWSAGGGGGRSDAAGHAAGGSGGGYGERWVLLSDLSATETVTVGAGGAAGASNGQDGSNGGDTTFGAKLTVYGGAKGAQRGAGNGAASTVGGGNAIIAPANSTVSNGVQYDPWTGGYGSMSSTDACVCPVNVTTDGRPSFMGGGGGAGKQAALSASAAGTSQGGGNGGAYGTGGTAPGGGGGGGLNTAAGAGAAGQVIVTVYDGA